MRLILGWQDGTVTELGASVRSVSDDIVDFEVNAVEGDWEPFLLFLGDQAGGGADGEPRLC